MWKCAKQWHIKRSQSWVEASVWVRDVARGTLGNMAQCRDWSGILDSGTSFFFGVSCCGRLSCSSNGCIPTLGLDATRDSGLNAGPLCFHGLLCLSSATNQSLIITWNRSNFLKKEHHRLLQINHWLLFGIAGTFPRRKIVTYATSKSAFFVYFPTIFYPQRIEYLQSSTSPS